jgi:hypothetical protein
LNHMEKNVYNGLQDIPTLHELAVHSIYSQVISQPYLQHIRGSDVNVLDLGPLHQQLIDHHQVLIDNPDILLSLDHYSDATLNGRALQNPDAICAVMDIAPKLPHLRSLLVEYLNGAKATWVRFSSEFSEGGNIANTTSIQKEASWMHATNDLNEGALGQVRVLFRRCPSMTLGTFNGRVQYKRNGTGEYVKNVVDPKVHQAVRKEVRDRDALGLEKQRKLEKAQADQEKVARTREKVTARAQKDQLAAQEMEVMAKVLDISELAKLTGKELDKQLKWHRTFDLSKPKRIPMQKDLKKVSQKLEAVREAVIWYTDNICRREEREGEGEEGELSLNVDRSENGSDTSSIHFRE